MNQNKKEDTTVGQSIIPSKGLLPRIIILGVITVVPLILAKGGMPGPGKLLALDGSKCYSVTLEEELNWVTSGSWTTGPDQRPKLILVDKRGAFFKGQVLGELVGISPEGAFNRNTNFTNEDRVSAQNPAQLHPDGEGKYMLLDDSRPMTSNTNRRLLFLNPLSSLRDRHADYFALSESIDLPMTIEAKPGHRELTVYDIYDMVRMGPSSGVLAFVDAEIREGERAELASAFVYFDVLRGEFQVFEEIPFKAGAVDERFNQYTRNMPFLAAIGNAGYILLLDHPRPRLVEVRSDARERELPSFPEEFRYRPRLVRQPEMHGAVESTVFDQIIENSTLAAGLYAWKEQLYLLGKKSSAPEGETAWWLIGLDAGTGQEISRVRLPTDSPNLTLVPGTYWALIEKGRAELVGSRHPNYVNRMAAGSMVLVPEHWLADPTSGNLEPVLRVNCDSAVGGRSHQQ